jgi:hypothetical protein
MELGYVDVDYRRQNDKLAARGGMKVTTHGAPPGKTVGLFYPNFSTSRPHRTPIGECRTIQSPGRSKR